MKNWHISSHLLLKPRREEKRREELDLFITSVNSFHPARKYTWEISENSLAFLDIKLSINDNGLSTSVHDKPTDSHNYLLHSSCHPQHVKNAIPFSQFLRLRRLCSDDSNFNNKCEETYQDWRTAFANTYDTQKKTTEMRPNQLRIILTPREHRKPQNLEQRFLFQLGTLSKRN